MQYSIVFSSLQPIKEELKDDQSWFELGHGVGVSAMDDEEEEVISQQDEDNKEIENLYTTTLEKHRRILKGTVYTVYSINCQCSQYPVL